MLTLQNTEAIRRIEEAIGYTFNDKRLLIQVLTRKTYLKIDPEAPDNEVLEFYGDTLMNYHVTNYFMSKYAHMLDDGLFFMRTVEQFTDMRSHYVCNRYLTDRIKAMGLARYLRAQNRDAELRRDGEKAYADVFESLVGAIYLDSCQNDTLIRAFILRQLGIEPKRLPADIEAFDYDSLIEPATTEFSAVSLEEPDHAETEPETLAVDAPVQMETAPMTEESSAVAFPVSEASESVAEVSVEAVAETVSEQVISEPLPQDKAESTPTSVVEETIAAVRTKQDELAAFCLEWGLDEPTYGQAPPNAPNARPVAACTMKYKDAKGKPVKISLNDSGKTLAEATEKAAVKMLKKLEKLTADGKIVSRPVAKVESETPVEVLPPISVPETTASIPGAPEDVTAGETVEMAPILDVEAVTAEPKEIIADAPAVEPFVAESDENRAEIAVMAAPETETGESTSVEDEDQLRIDVIDSVEPIAERSEWKNSDVVEKPVEDVVAATEPNTEEIVTAEPVPVEETKSSKPSRKKKSESAGAKSPAKRKPSAKADKSENGDTGAEPNEGSKPEAAETTSKPRTRKPRTKQQTETVAVIESTGELSAESAIATDAEPVTVTSEEPTE